MTISEGNGEGEQKGFSEREVVLRQVGKKFYDQCKYYAELFDSRHLVKLDEDMAVAADPRLKNFELSGAGKLTEYRNAKGQLCEIITREEQEGLIEFCLLEIQDEAIGFEVIGDWQDSYLLSQQGDILAAEHLEVIDEDQWSNTPILIHPEDLMHKIMTDFHAQEPPKA